MSLTLIMTSYILRLKPKAWLFFSPQNSEIEVIVLEPWTVSSDGDGNAETVDAFCDIMTLELSRFVFLFLNCNNGRAKGKKKDI